MSTKRDITPDEAARILTATDKANQGRGIGTRGPNNWTLEDALRISGRAISHRLVTFNRTVSLHLLTHHGVNLLYVAPEVADELGDTDPQRAPRGWQQLDS